MSSSFQERRFLAEYDQLKIKFISDHYSLVKDREAAELVLNMDDPTKISPYLLISMNVINRLSSKIDNSREKLDIDSKFKLLNVARRAEIMEYSNNECDTRVKQMLTEATKLDVPWRKNAIIDLLTKYKDVSTDDVSKLSVKASLYEAAYIRDVHFDNIYFKFQIARSTIRILNRVLITLLSIILGAAAIYEYLLDKPFIIGTFSDLWIVVLFGLLGGAFSTLLNLYKGNRLQNSTIKQLDSFNLTIARLVIGASAGLIAFMLLNSGFILIKGFNDAASTLLAGEQAMVNGPRPLTLSMLALIFVAGFTERIILNFVDKLSNQKDPPDK